LPLTGFVIFTSPAWKRFADFCDVFLTLFGLSDLDRWQGELIVSAQRYEIQGQKARRTSVTRLW